jgi:hypothetical protein
MPYFKPKELLAKQHMCLRESERQHCEACTLLFDVTCSQPSVCAGEPVVPKELMQAKKGLVAQALYAVPAKQMHVTWLVEQPSLLAGFHIALKTLPGAHQRLCGFTLWARLCHIDLSRSSMGNLPGLWRCGGQRYWAEAQSSGVFDLAFDTLACMLTVWLFISADQ